MREGSWLTAVTKGDRVDRETRLARTFVELADTLVDDYDIHEFLQRLTHRCAELVEASAVGVLLTDSDGVLRLAAASSSDLHALELFEMQKREGPCYEAFLSGEQTREDDIEGATERWPRFTPQALKRGFKSVHAFPLRVRKEALGALNVFFNHPGPFSDADILALQALADVAAIGILQQRSVQESTDLAEHLRTALDSRVVIERAVGILVERRGVGTREAFESIRSYARSNNQRVHAVAQAIIDGAVPAEKIESHN